MFGIRNGARALPPSGWSGSVLVFQEILNTTDRPAVVWTPTATGGRGGPWGLLVEHNTPGSFVPATPIVSNVVQDIQSIGTLYTPLSNPATYAGLAGAQFRVSLAHPDASNPRFATPVATGTARGRWTIGSQPVGFSSQTGGGTGIGQTPAGVTFDSVLNVPTAIWEYINAQNLGNVVIEYRVRRSYNGVTQPDGIFRTSYIGSSIGFTLASSILVFNRHMNGLNSMSGALWNVTLEVRVVIAPQWSEVLNFNNTNSLTGTLPALATGRSSPWYTLASGNNLAHTG